MDEERRNFERFVRGQADPAAFPHEQHVRMGFEMLRRHDFAKSAHLYSRALRSMVARINRPEVFNQTITIAFLALIAERMAATQPTDFAAFAAANPDLLERTVLSRWYRPERLKSEVARRTFVLPDA